MAQMRAFSVLQKWPKIAKMTPNDLLTLKMVFTEPKSFIFLKFIISKLFQWFSAIIIIIAKNFEILQFWAKIFSYNDDYCIE